MRSLCGKLGIQTSDVEVVLRVPSDDLTRFHSYSVTRLDPYHTKLPLEEYLSMLITLDFKQYGRQIPTALLAIRRLFMKDEATKGLMIEFLDYNCGWIGPIWISAISGRYNELALNTWEDNVFQQKLDGFFTDQRSGMIEVVATFPSEKALCEREDRWWMEGDDGSQPLICIAARDASHPNWWNTVLPALRRWLKSDEFVFQYGIKFGVLLVLRIMYS